MKQPTPVFLSYMDFPYAIEGGSTINFFWVLNKLYMANREAILITKVDFGASDFEAAVLLQIEVKRKMGREESGRHPSGIIGCPPLV